MNINMEEINKSYYTIGKFAEKADVTLRTLRYYDNIGLLKPSLHNSSGNRLYTHQDFARLQKILTLKFIGLSLEEIFQIMKYDINEMDFKKSLELQREIMDEKINHIKMIKNAIDETLEMMENENVLNWNKFINIISVINMDKKWLVQYQNAFNLRARIKIHELYSTNKIGWMEWLFDKLEIPQNAHILELGCGDGSLWVKNIDKIPDSWDITLTDFSEGMLKDAKDSLSYFKKNKFKYKIVDAMSIPYKDNSFDVVIANHMFYHVANREKAFAEIHRVLKCNGYFYASTVGKNHMVEMRNIISKFASNDITTKSWNLTESFQLENGYDQISKLFRDVELERYEDSLIVTEAAPLVDYLFSMPGNTKEIFHDEKLNQLVLFIESEIKKLKGIHITKDTGFFKSRK